MLSVFPELFFLAPFSALVIRMALGSVFIYCALQHIGNSKTPLRMFGVAEATLAAAFIAGVWTQPAAILGALVIGTWFARPQVRPVALGTALLSLVLSLTLLIMGAGPLAFDLPL